MYFQFTLKMDKLFKRASRIAAAWRPTFRRCLSPWGRPRRIGVVPSP
jgi:hypothetical protein